MASFPIQAPSPVSLCGGVAGNWKTFECAWNYYSIATGLSAKIVKGEALKGMNSLPTMAEDDKKTLKPS